MPIKITSFLETIADRFSWYQLWFEAGAFLSFVLLLGLIETKYKTIGFISGILFLWFGWACLFTYLFRRRPNPGSEISDSGTSFVGDAKLWIQQFVSYWYLLCLFGLAALTALFVGKLAS